MAYCYTNIKCLFLIGGISTLNAFAEGHISTSSACEQKSVEQVEGQGYYTPPSPDRTFFCPYDEPSLSVNEETLSTLFGYNYPRHEISLATTIKNDLKRIAAKLAFGGSRKKILEAESGYLARKGRADNRMWSAKYLFPAARWAPEFANPFLQPELDKRWKFLLNDDTRPEKLGPFILLPKVVQETRTEAFRRLGAEGFEGIHPSDCGGIPENTFAIAARKQAKDSKGNPMNLHIIEIQEKLTGKYLYTETLWVDVATRISRPKIFGSTIREISRRLALQFKIEGLNNISCTACHAIGEPMVKSSGRWEVEPPSFVGDANVKRFLFKD